MAGAEANHKRMVLLLLGVILTLTALEVVGYLIAFFVFLIVSLRGLGIRSSVKALTISGGFVALVYFVFGAWLKLSLPLGIVAKLFSG